MFKTNSGVEFTIEWLDKIVWPTEPGTVKVISCICLSDITVSELRKKLVGDYFTMFSSKIEIEGLESHPIGGSYKDKRFSIRCKKVS